MFEIIEDQQELFVLEIVGKCLQWLLAPRLLEIDGFDDRPDDEGRAGDWGQRHEVDTVRKGVEKAGSNLQGESGLARAAGAGEGHQPSALPSQQAGYLGDLPFAPPDGGRLVRAVC